MYGEIGPGVRTALLKLAVQQRESSNRSIRIGIDFSIWTFQIQLGKGGTNADLRTLFYRLLRLQRLAIQPLFVFDGPHKPPFKRNKKTNVTGGSALNLVATELFDLFGFPYIHAPGEAEAECAILQQRGIVDAVLSEDVDTLMFGCTLHLRNWTSEGTRGNKSPTHVDVYHASDIKAGKSGLDREGMVLVALMSGGDYVPAGIPGCGPKVACEAARAGFGSDLFNINAKDAISLRQWRERLEYELRSNESGFFRTRHKTLQIPENFPDKAVLYYYMHPVVSNEQQIQKYRDQIKWSQVNILGLRRFCVKAFDWRGYTGLRHFVRVAAPAVLGQRLAEGLGGCSSFDDMDIQAEEEEKQVRTVCGRRNHITADGIPELRVGYIPKDVIGLDLEAELQAEKDIPVTHTAVFSSDEEAEPALELEASIDPVPAHRRKRGPSTYDPAKPEKEWFPETYVKLGVPLTVENWEAEMRDPKTFATRKIRAKSKLNGGMRNGAIEPFLRVRKPGYRDRMSSPIEDKAPPIHVTKTGVVVSALASRSQNTDGSSRKRGSRSSKNSSQGTASLVATQPLERSYLKTNQICDLPSSMPAGGYSFRPPAFRGNTILNTKIQASDSHADECRQKKTVVILSSSPTAPENFPIESSQRGPTKKMSGRTIEDLSELESEYRFPYGNTLLASDDSDLPSPARVLYPRKKRSKTSTISSERAVAAKEKIQRSGQRVTLRDSLVGSWKVVDDDQLGYTTPSQGFAGVEVLDLTCT